MAQYELNLRDYLRILRKRKFVIIATVIFCTLGVGFHSSRQVPIYEASATVKVEERRTIISIITDTITRIPGDKMESQARIISGYPIMKKVALRLRYVDEKTLISSKYASPSTSNLTTLLSYFKSTEPTFLLFNLSK